MGNPGAEETNGTADPVTKAAAPPQPAKMAPTAKNPPNKAMESDGGEEEEGEEEEEEEEEGEEDSEEGKHRIRMNAVSQNHMFVVQNGVFI